MHTKHLAAACYCFITTTFEVFLFPFFFVFLFCRNLGWEISRLQLYQRMFSPASNYPSRISSCYSLYKECWFQFTQTNGASVHLRLQWASWGVNRNFVWQKSWWMSFFFFNSQQSWWMFLADFGPDLWGNEQSVLQWKYFQETLKDNVGNFA